MEHYDPSRRQYAPTSYPAQQPQQQAPQTAGPYTTPGSVERFRQSNYMQQSPTAAQSSSRASHDAQQLYNFSQGVQYATGTNIPANQMQYGQEYQPQEPRQQTQPYHQYGAGVMYGMQPGQPQAQQAYDQGQTFRQSRTGAAPETLPSQFGEAPAAHYYNLAGQNVPTSAPSAELATPQVPSQYSQTAYAQPGSSTQQSYPMLDPAQSAAYSAYNQSYPAAQLPQLQQADNIDHAFKQYQTSVQTIFRRAQEGNLQETPDFLIRVSQYLLGHAEGLGLTRDDESLHDSRIRLWDEFNRAWFVTLQRQVDLTQEMIQSGQGLHESQSIISTPALEQLARELVRLCDDVEKHGLVDYQMGVAEEEIMDLILRCLALLDAPSDRRDDLASRPESSSAAAGRQR